MAKPSGTKADGDQNEGEERSLLLGSAHKMANQTRSLRLAEPGESTRETRNAARWGMVNNARWSLWKVVFKAAIQ